MNEEKISEKAFNNLLAEEKKLRMDIRSVPVNLMRDEIETIAKIFKEHKKEKEIIKWAHIHNRNRRMLEKMGKPSASLGTSQVLLQAGDILFHENSDLRDWYDKEIKDI